MIELSCAVHGRYVPHSAVLILSALEHHEVRVHYLHGPGLSRRDRRRLGEMTAAHGGEIAFVKVPDERVAGLPVREYFTQAMWYRTFLPELLGDSDRVLYLDVDTLVLDDLAPLWSTDFGDALVGAVTNVLEPWGEWWPEKLGLPGPEAYFNSGVLLMNLEGMRAERTSERLVEHVRAHAEDLYWPDQDALNALLHDRRVALEPRFNAMNNVHLRRERAEELFGADAVREAVERPAIRHFEGPAVAKPWHRGSTMPDRERYLAYRRRTPWPRVPRFRA
jgi:lipopolysaccharide biosynthesis glycosyltransferase